mmetsp:Transcript_49868/g.79574  ORF Transcript_49868/g.79574 Transcript_49868/m.79574 type:complete len:250 (+) Transcript_49868:246-995(+)
MRHLLRHASRHRDLPFPGPAGAVAQPHAVHQAVDVVPRRLRRAAAGRLQGPRQRLPQHQRRGAEAQGHQGLGAAAAARRADGDVEVAGHVEGHLVDHGGLPTSQRHRLGRPWVAAHVAAGARHEAIGAGLDQALRLADGDRGTRQDLHQGVGRLQPRNQLQLRIDPIPEEVQHVGAGRRQRPGPGLVRLPLPRRHGGRHQELAGNVAGHLWKITDFFQVTSCDHRDQPIFGIQDQEFSNLALLQHFQSF